MKCHYRKVKKEVKKGLVVDVYSSPYDKVTPEDWRHLVDDVWLSEKHKRKSKAGKKNRKKLGPGGHCSGSRSFVAAMTTPPEDNGYADLDFPEFYEKTHTKKDKSWIHNDCPINHTKMRSLREESSQSGLQLTPEEMSREVLGKRKRYILGFGVGPKPTSSSSSQTDVVSRARDEEFQKMQADMEKMQMEREEEKREREEEKREREETRIVREEERREREQERREREEEKRQNEAQQNKLAALLLQWQEKTPPHSSPIHHGVLISPTSIGGRKACS